MQLPDLQGFWQDSDYGRREYVDEPPSDGMVAEVERELGYRLPEAYVALARIQNGGIPERTSHRTREATSWAEDHIAITGIYSIGRAKRCSLLGGFGSRFWIEEWGYPEIGIYFADCPSAGHDMMCLDYRECGPEGEPRVVHVDQEGDYAITPVAESFEAFIRGLESDEAFDLE
ncbi:SMI1/KNR4 family protein [Lujinxingia litoralis]|uniref:SMI1/KNR4 family protein n=1 Tax=Lujinxingia litoralis TaxID=2211119 RepID=A0A328CAV1_9DELT|nr:SMI1/KNR4 family protein [Lujinxingia litoralis]RAL25148.1 SMI1/KNR4 family protein [Lujinxingia litoralis]